MPLPIVVCVGGGGSSGADSLSRGGRDGLPLSIVIAMADAAGVPLSVIVAAAGAVGGAAGFN